MQTELFIGKSLPKQLQRWGSDDLRPQIICTNTDPNGQAGGVGSDLH